MPFWAILMRKIAFQKSPPRSAHLMLARSSATVRGRQAYRRKGAGVRTVVASLASLLPRAEAVKLTANERTQCDWCCRHGPSECLVETDKRSGHLAMIRRSLPMRVFRTLPAELS